MFRRKKKDEGSEEISTGRKWSFRKKRTLVSKTPSSSSLNVEAPSDKYHHRSATEPAKIQLSHQINPERGPSSMDAVKKSFQRHFPRLYFTGEIVIKSFTCALEKDIIMQGKLYLTPQYACFYSNVFNRNYTLEIAYAQVTKLEKRNTIGMIPNAISVWIEGEVHFFLSFAKRDLAFDLMIEFWENLKISENELDASFEALSKPLEDDMLFLNDGNGFKQISVQTSELRRNQTLGPPGMDDRNFSKTASVASSNFPESIVNTPLEATPAGEFAIGDRLSTTKASIRRHGRSPRGSLSFSSGSPFGPEAPLSWELLEIMLDVDFLNVFGQLFSDSWNSWTQIHKICGTNGLFVGNWKQEENCIVRNLIYSPKIKMPQSTSTVMFMEKQVFKKYNTYVKLESSIRLQNSTYSDLVEISIRYTSAMNSLNKSRLTISSQTDYLKKNIHSKSQIESAILDWLIVFHSCFLSYIKEKFHTGGEHEAENSLDHQSPKPSGQETTLVVQPSPSYPRSKDYRFWIALGIIISLFLAIIIKMRLQIVDGPDESLADQLVKAKKKLFEQEMYILDLWAKLKEQMEERKGTI